LARFRQICKKKYPNIKKCLSDLNLSKNGKNGFDEGYFRKGRAIGMTMPKKESACKRFFLHLKEYRQ
jgi:hypothetical protein